MTALADDQDAFGHLLHDYLAGQDVSEVIERDDGFVGTVGSPRRYFMPYRDWPAHERKAMESVQGRVLDVGCGAGRHSLYLWKKGMRVTSLDLSPLAVSVCRRRGLPDTRVLDINQLDPASGPWDTILLLGANLGLAANPTDGTALLARLAAATSEGARILAESLDPWVVTEPVHVAHLEENLRRGRLPGHLTIRIRYKQRYTPWFEYLFLAKEELRRLLEGTAWRVMDYLDHETEPGAYIALIEKIGRVSPL